jgi:putative Na+/H+ antiporter
MIIFPDQYGYGVDQMTFAQPKHIEERSAYEAVGKWIKNKLK